tara:strand:- start:1792 stop:2973 length:1182 start_codon:yes stop_codon:yes gene_type:complete
MDLDQSNHLKAYGLSYWVLEKEISIDWLLNYRGGSFVLPHIPSIEKECKLRNIKYEVLANAQYNNILSNIGQANVNQDVMKLEKAPKVAVYSPKNKQPWDDAVTLVLAYAEIPYDVIYDDEVLLNKLPEYDWLHLHHEDFTGQYGKFYKMYHNAPWYKEQVREFEASAANHGFKKVSHLKLGIAKKIKDFVIGGGFLFAMCSATDSYDIALAAEGVDLCATIYDHDPADPEAQNKLNFERGLAFEEFQLEKNPYVYEYSNIDATRTRKVKENEDYFTLFEFSAKWDPIPTILTQNHTRIIKAFMGQTTSFNKSTIKPNVLIMGENKIANEAKYIHSEYGMGFFTFYGGHDPEDYVHYVGDPPTDLNLHPSSPGYRLILNNILFPAAKEKKRKT